MAIGSRPRRPPTARSSGATWGSRRGSNDCPRRPAGGAAENPIAPSRLAARLRLARTEAPMRMAILVWILALAMIGSIACDMAGPETVPQDPGTVIGRVTDQSGAPLSNVWVYVHDIPN